MGYEDIRLKLVGDSVILRKVNELEELTRQIRKVVTDLSDIGFIRIDSDAVGGASVGIESVDTEKE